MRTLSSILRSAAIVLILGSAMLHSQNLIAVSEHKSARIPGTSASPSILGPADVIHIDVWQNIDLTEMVTIGPDGFISLPLLGDGHVVGMTANQLAQDQRTKLGTARARPFRQDIETE